MNRGIDFLRIMIDFIAFEIDCDDYCSIFFNSENINMESSVMLLSIVPFIYLSCISRLSAGLRFIE